MSTPSFKTFDHEGKNNCQNCFRADSRQYPLLSCACKHVRYCDKACQKADWKSHKVLCEQNRAVLKSLCPVATHANGVTQTDGFMISKKWVQIHKHLLGATSTNAMNLHDFPKRLDTHLFKVTLSPTFDGQSIPKTNKEVGLAFKLVLAKVLSMEQAIASCHADMRASVAVNIKGCQEKSETFKKQGPEWLGVVITMVVIPQFDILRIVPYAAPYALGPRNVDNWESTFREMLMSGVKSVY